MKAGLVAVGIGSIASMGAGIAQADRSDGHDNHKRSNFAHTQEEQLNGALNSCGTIAGTTHGADQYNPCDQAGNPVGPGVFSPWR